MGMNYERLEGKGLQWPCTDINHPGIQILHEKQFSRGKGLFHAVEYRGAAEFSDEKFPLMLTTGRSL